jgi:hypothetical protein
MTTNHDFDRLSAYLDNQLSPGDRAALEKRLAAEPELRAALHELRLTVRALRDLSAVKLPRSFTLTPAHVGARAASRRAPFFPVLRFATALSALALVVVLAGDLGGGMLATSAGQDLTDGGEAEVASVMVTDTVEEAAPAEVPAPSETPVAAMDVLSGAGEGSDGTDEAALEAADATQPVSLVAPEAAMTPTQTGSVDRAMSPTAEPSPKSLDSTSTPLAVADAPPSATDDVFYSADADPGTAQAIEPAPRRLSPLRVMELALVMLTVLLGAAAWLTRRNG